VSVCLDAFALLAWLQSEPGADLVESYLSRAETASGWECYISTINLGEVVYRLWRTRSREHAETFAREVRSGLIPLTLVDASRRRVLEAAGIKARHRLAYADAFAVQGALEKRLGLITGDPEIRDMETERPELIWIGEGPGA
jgi:uncharacterized protein